MWLWILIGLTIVTKVHGYSNGRFPKSCESMAPVHASRGGILYTPQTTDPPFVVDYLPISKPGEPITVLLKSKQSTNFRGFLLEAREVEDKGRPVGKFIMLEPDTTQLLTCGDLTDSAVSQTNNRQKNLIRVNWTAQGQEQELNVIFRATFVQSFTTFWERVSVPLPQPTSTPEPSTTTSTPEPSTTTSTPESSTTTSTPHRSTTTSTPEPCTTSTPQPSTTTSTLKPSTTTSIPKPSTTKSTTEPLLKDPCTTPFNIGERETTMLMCLDCVLEEIKLEISNVITVLFASSPFYHYVNKVSKVVGSTLCAAIEILSLILVCAGDSCKVTLIALVCVVIVINFIEMVIVSLSIGSSHELKGISDFSVKVCFVIHEIFTISVIFVGVMEMDNCTENRRESWLGKVMFAFTAWISLVVVWVLVFSAHNKGTQRRSRMENLENSYIQRQPRKQKHLRAATVIPIAVSVILIVGTTSFAAAVIVGIFECQKN